MRAVKASDSHKLRPNIPGSAVLEAPSFGLIALHMKIREEIKYWPARRQEEILKMRPLPIFFPTHLDKYYRLKGFNLEGRVLVQSPIGICLLKETGTLLCHHMNCFRFYVGEELGW